MSSGAAVCAACRVTRPMDALLAVTARATGRVRYVCRPSIADQLPGRAPCFGVVRSAADESIELATASRRPVEAARDLERSERRGRVGALMAATQFVGGAL